jgi:hypothetical protein
MYFENFPISTCTECEQGWIVIVKEISSNKLFVYCNECEAEWATPKEFFLGRHCSRFKFSKVTEPSYSEITKIGWDRYINR